MAQISQTLILKVMTMTLIASTLGTSLASSQAKADVDPALCGLGGAAAGALVGNQFGKGDGKTAMTIIGAVLGAAGGHNYCKQADPSDMSVARENERMILVQNSNEGEWSNPRYGHSRNAHSRIERRGYYGNRECTMTRSVMQANDGGRYVNETYWCQNGGQWTQVTETTTISQIRWGASGPVQSTTTETTTTYQGGGVQMMPPRGMRPPREMAPTWIVNDNRIERFKSDLRREWAHPERAAQDFARDLSMSGQFMTMDQLGHVLTLTSFDSGRMAMLQFLAPQTDQRIGSMSSVMNAFTFDSGREEARRFFDQAPRGASREQRWEHQHRR